MRYLVQAVFAVLFLSIATAQEPARDCTVGKLKLGGPAPKITSAEYERGRSDWFEYPRAKHYKSLLSYGRIPYVQFIAIKDGTLVAIIREFTVQDSPDVLEALQARYGPAEGPRGAWLSFFGDCSEDKHVVWFDAECGIRIDAFPSADPGDPDERMAAVWTKAVKPPPTTGADASIR